MINLPSSLNSVGTMIPSFHRCNRSDIIGHKYPWILLGDCTLELERILMHIKFDIQYLKNCNHYIKCNQTVNITKYNPPKFRWKVADQE